MLTQIPLVFDSFFMILLSAAFLFFGLLIYFYDQYYKKHSIKVDGKIAGIEKYISQSRSSNSKSSSLMYRPIVSFIKNGKEYFFESSLSKSSITDEIGEKVKVAIIHDTPHTARIAGRNFLRNFSYALLIISGIVLALIFNQVKIPITIKMVRLLLPFIINLIVFKLILKKINQHGGMKILMLKNNSLVEKEELMKRDIFWQSFELEREEQRVHKPFLIINPILMVLAAWPAVIFGERLSNREFIIKNFNENLLSIDMAKNFMSTIMADYYMKQEFLILAISIFFFCCFAYSLIFCLKKTSSNRL